MLKSIFIEGIQGSGKTTLVHRFQIENPRYHWYREGDYSPIELAWCAWVTNQEFQQILARYPAISGEICKKSVQEGERFIIPYTQILTEIPGFHKDLEQYEIYNGNKSPEDFKEIIKSRFAAWVCGEEIFECSLFQNIVETMILYYEMEEEEILRFYGELGGILQNKIYEIYYIEVKEVRNAEEKIRRERCDENGNEMWFPLMVAFLENSPYGVTHGLKGMDGLVTHFEHRVRLEKKILKEVFQGKYHIIQRAVV